MVVGNNSNKFRSLWSVSTVNLIITRSGQYSSAQVVASASFSIGAYLHSALVIDLLAYATGRTSPQGCSCIITAPSPKILASAETTVSLSGL